MKNVKIVVPATSTSEMNNLVNIICREMEQDSGLMKDKFKMIDMANPKKIMDLCEYLKLKVEYRFNKKKPEIAVDLKVKENFTLESNEELLYENSYVKKSQDELKEELLNNIPGIPEKELIAESIDVTDAFKGKPEESKTDSSFNYNKEEEDIPF